MIKNHLNNQHIQKAFIEFVLGVIFTGAIIWILYKIAHLENLSPATLRDYIRSFGHLAALAYIISYILDTLALFPPMVGFAVTAGLVFGPFWGCINLFIAAMIGTNLAFFISRIFGRGWVEKMIPKRFKNIDDLIEKRGFLTILFLRIIPIVPYEILNYASGLSKVRYKDYFFATAVGLIPGIIISVFFGDTLGSVRHLQDILTPQFIFSSFLFILAALLPFVYYYVKKRHALDKRRNAQIKAL